MTIDQSEKLLISKLSSIYELREASAICDRVMQHLTKQKKVDRIIHKTVELDESLAFSLQQFVDELMNHRPVQYVLGEAWFMGLSFFVDERVLIPRPETEELVEWILKEHVGMRKDLVVVDVGTGSGCIPITLKTKMRDAHILGCDISKGALEVAAHNASRHGAQISLLHGNFLNPLFWQQLPDTDILVSNPPYVPFRDKSSMEKHVLEFEPHEALFVPDNDPLVFYKALAGFARKKLRPGGKLFAELHVEASAAAKQLMLSEGFVVELREDIQGITRMIKATLLP